MIDVTLLEAFALTSPGTREERRDAGERETIFVNAKKIFTDALKNAIHRDSSPRLSLPFKFPYFIALAGICEVLVYVCATDDIRDFLIYSPVKKCDLWRFLTYMLLHNGWIHLSLNIVIQFLLACPLEFEQGHVRTAAVYVGGGLAGSLGASIFDNESLLVGASGGIYALLISQVSHVVLNYKTLKYVCYRAFVVFLLVLSDVFYICYHVHVFKNENPRIGLAAHFAGAISGFLLGSLFFNGTVKWKNHIHITSAIIVIILLTLAILFNVINTTRCVN